jgi:hypothetical protein|tara:strand:- start:1607 stop:2509 length:903 start_codon:yes stop_codon:yes gene_type:complete
MTVKEIREKLVTDFGYSTQDLLSIKKAELTNILTEEVGASSLDVDFGEGENSGDFNVVEDEVEEMNDLLEEQEAVPPSMADPKWSDYVISKLEWDEAVDGNPTVDGLRRVTEFVLGPIVSCQTEIIQVPTKENEGRATAVCTVTVQTGDGLKRVSGSGDAWHKNTDMPYSKFPVAMAETRAEGRALRRLLQLKKVVAAEELSDTLDDSIDYDKNINDNQVNFIEVLCRPEGRGLDVNVAKLVNETGQEGPRHTNIRQLKHTEATKFIKMLSSYQNNPDDIPEIIRGYDAEWRSYFDVSNS